MFPILQQSCMRYFAVINMASNKAYIKYMFGLFLYFCVCTFCLILKKNYPLATSFQLKNNTSSKKCSTVHTPSKQHVKRQDDPFFVTVKELEYNAVRGELINVQDSYLQTISNTCHNYDLSTVLVKRHYLYSPNNSSLYCWIRKVASTSFTKLYSDLRNRRVSKDYYKEIDILSPKTDEELRSFINNDRVFKFLIVRHPFERIVSSYRDRIENNKKYTAQAWIYAQRIFHLTRPDLFVTNAKTGSSLSRIFDNDKRLKLVPTFKEFITWLLQEPTSNDDVHWDSYYSHCSVCDIDYDYVLKLENYSFEDVDFVFQKMGVNKNEVYMPRLEQTDGGFTDYYRTCSYLKNLSPEMTLKLYERYKIDFEMFDYKHENYLECDGSKVS